MDHFPVEIWQKIGCHACLDGGYTGCSLSEVSRGMRSAMRLVRHTSISITSVNGCLIYEALTDKIGYNLPIRHLLISVPIARWGPEAIPREKEIVISRAINKILSLAAQTLITLTVHSPDWFDLFENNLQFPHLLDMSLPDVPRKDQQPTLNMLPVLERLHISHAGRYTQSIQFWELIAKFIPSLVSIRFSSVSTSWLPPFLRIFLDIPADANRGFVYANLIDEFPPDSEDASSAATVASQLDRLVCVILQPWKYPSGGRCGTGEMEHGNMVEVLKTIAMCTKDRKEGERRLWMLEESTRYGPEEALVDWMEVVSGRDGLWRLPK